MVTKGRGYQTGYQGISGFQESGFQGRFHGKRHLAAVNKALVNALVNSKPCGTHRTGTQAGTHGKRMKAGVSSPTENFPEGQTGEVRDLAAQAATDQLRDSPAFDWSR